MRCGFCGYDNPDGAKKCKHCKAKLKLQQPYERGTGAGFGGNVSQAGPGVTRQGTGSTAGTRQGSTTGTWQSTGGSAGTRQGTQYAGSQTPYRAGSMVTDNMARLRNVSSMKAVKWIVVLITLVPFIFMIVVFLMIRKVNREWLKDEEFKAEGLDDLKEDIQEYYNLTKNGYSLTKDSDNNYTMDVNGFLYRMVNYKSPFTNENDWRSDYFTDTFKRITQGNVNTAVRSSSFGPAVTTVMYDVTGLFPTWLNYVEIDRVCNGEANRTKWTNAWFQNQSWTVIVIIVIDEDYPFTRECFEELEDDLFFATEIIVKCHGRDYRYYPYEDRFEEY